MDKLETNFIQFIPYEQNFMLDYAIDNRKLTVKLLKENDLIYSKDNEESVVKPIFELESKILINDNWTVCIIDFRDFKNLGEKRKDWLIERLEESYKLSTENYDKIHLEKRLKILRYDLDHLKYYYHDRNYVEANRRYLIVEKL